MTRFRNIALALSFLIFSYLAFGQQYLSQVSTAAPGYVPIGGMVAVMPTIATGAGEAWQPPATGVIKDGFMRADGHQITAGNVTAGSKIPLNTYLPDMVAMMPRGATASCDGTAACNAKAGGSNKMVTANMIEHTHAPSLYVSAANFEHSHSDNFSVASSGAHLHNWRITSLDTVDVSGTGPRAVVGLDTTNSGNHAHAVSGSVGADNISTNRTVSGSNANAGQATPDDFIPEYQTVVWVIRVL